MNFHLRKLLGEPLNITQFCESICEKDNDRSNCNARCSCPNGYCTSFFIPPPPSPLLSAHNSHKANTFLTVTIFLLAASFLVVCGYAFYTRYYLPGRNCPTRRSSLEPESESDPTHDDFLDEDHGPAVDHPIWYIRTIGLQPSIIGSITVLKYKRNDGLVEGTDCSVCLNEFEENESLRLLPKCSHAFHIACIDTWLRSHTNCPMCRAPIVNDSVVKTPSPEPGSVDSGPAEETQMGMSENDGGIDRGIEEGTEEGRKRGENSSDEEVDRTQPSRRSFSLDSLSALKILNRSLCKVDGDSDKKLKVLNRLSSENGRKKRIGGNQKLQRIKGSSSSGRSLQSGPVSMKRSVSCSGKFVLGRQI